MDSKDKKFDVGSEVGPSGVNSSSEVLSHKASKADMAGKGMEPVAAKRRQFIIAALAAPPILMTLTSRPVYAVQALSNMLSTEGSGCRGDTRYGGMSPGFWKHYDDQGGTDVYGESHAAAWNKTGYKYGDPILGSTESKEYKRFSEGMTYRGADLGSDTRPLRVILNEDEGSEKFHLIAGLLNCRYFDAKAGGGVTQYFMTEAQFRDMLNNPSHVPRGYTSLRELIEINYHGKPSKDGQC